jgi:UDP-N-acetyl-D-galactosamine dehydrogenase
LWLRNYSILITEFFESRSKIKNLPSAICNIKIAIIGLGYVGLPLAVAFGERYAVVGYDISERRVKELNEGVDSTGELAAEEMDAVQGVVFTCDAGLLRDCNVYIITVPTPLTPAKEPDLSYLLAASETVGRCLGQGDLVIYESTVYPGCTEEDCVPVLEKASGLVYNRDFFCGYSPERINPGDKVHTVTKIRKLVSGSTPEAAERVNALYGSVITAGTYLAPSIRVAEAAKARECPAGCEYFFHERACSGLRPYGH